MVPTVRSFGRKGQNNGEFRFPKGIAFDSHDNIVVVDCWNHRLQVFDRNGNFLSKFGEQRSDNNQLKLPQGLRYKPGASDLCRHLDKKVSLLESLTGPGGWQ